MAEKRFFTSRAVLVGALLLYLFSMPLSAEQKIHKTFDVRPGGTLLLETERGSITVTTAKQNTVSVEVTLSARRGNERKIIDAFEVSFDHRGADVAIEGEFRSSWLNRRARNYLRVHYEITVPEKYNVDLKTSGGDIHIADLTGDVLCTTSGGDLELGTIKGRVRGRTSGGDISLQASEGVAEIKTSGGDIYIGKVASRVDAKTSGGSIKIDRALGPVIARTSGGDIIVDEVLAEVDAKTSGGTIRVTISRQPEHDSRLATSGGSITVRLAPGLNLDVDAKTSGGSVKTDIPMTVLGKMSKSRINGKIGDGGPGMYLKTSGGSIHIVSD